MKPLHSRHYNDLAMVAPLPKKLQAASLSKYQSFAALAGDLRNLKVLVFLYLDCLSYLEMTCRMKMDRQKISQLEVGLEHCVARAMWMAIQAHAARWKTAVIAVAMYKVHKPTLFGCVLECHADLECRKRTLKLLKSSCCQQDSPHVLWELAAALIRRGLQHNHNALGLAAEEPTFAHIQQSNDELHSPVA